MHPIPNTPHESATTFPLSTSPIKPTYPYTHSRIHLLAHISFFETCCWQPILPTSCICAHPTPHLSLSLSLSISLLSSHFGVQTSTLSSQTEADSPWKWCRQEAHPCLCRTNFQVVKVPSPFPANLNEEITGRQPAEIRGGAGSGGALSDAAKGAARTRDVVARRRGAAAAWTSFESPGDASHLRSSVVTA